MFGQASLCCPKPSAPRRRLPLRPVLEELEPRLTPAEVGLNDFRLSFMGNDGNPKFDASSPAVAYNARDHEYLVVWSGDDVTDNEYEVFGQRLDAATGALVGGKIRISDMGPDGDTKFAALAPAVAYNGVNNEYLVVWQGDDTTDQEYEIFGQRLDGAMGAEVGVNDFRLSDMGPEGNPDFDAFFPAVAYNGAANEYLVVWYGDDKTALLVNEEYEIFGQRLDAVTGTPVGANDFRISDMGPDGNADFDAFHPAVAYNGVNNQYLVVWSGADNTGILVAGEFEIFGQQLNAATGAPVGANDFRISDMGPDGDIHYGASSVAVAYNGVANEYLVVWNGNDSTAPLANDEVEIFGQRLDAATGAEAGVNDFRLSDMGPEGNPDFGAFSPAVAYNGVNNEYLVAWQGADNSGNLVAGEYEIFGQRLDAATGAQLGANDFRLSDMGPDGNADFDASAPAVAYNGAANEYLVVWQGDDNTGNLVNDEYEIFGQRFAPPPPPSPSPPSPPPAQIAAVLFRQKGVARVRVTDAATGAQRGVLTPFRGFRGRLRLALRDLNGDGSLDLLVQAVVKGRRKHKAYDAVTLAPLPPTLT
jgi:hypothetical protein